MQEKHSTLHIHFGYLVSILTAVIIIMASIRWTDLRGFTEYLTAAATMTSLVLAILAIILTFISSDSVSKLLGRLIQASEGIAASSVKIDSVAKSGEDLAARADVRDHKMIGLFEALGSQVESLGQATRNLDQATARIEQGIAVIPGRLDQIQERMGKAVQPSLTTDAQKPASGAVNDMEQFFSRSSLVGLLVLLAARFAMDHQRTLDLNWLAEKTNWTVDYLWGFIVASHAAGAVETTPTKGPIYTVNAVQETAAQLEKRLREQIERQQTDSFKERMKKGIQLIVESYPNPQIPVTRDAPSERGPEVA
jgi:hypothetical protein